MFTYDFQILLRIYSGSFLSVSAYIGLWDVSGYFIIVYIVIRLHWSTEADRLTHTVVDEKSLEFILLCVAPAQFNKDDEHIALYFLFPTHHLPF
jgi:hypothetical protein